jgi:multiple sugar transport system substrate-binding protein
VKNPKPKAWRALALGGSLVVVASVLAACGGDDGDSAEDTQPTSTATGPVEDPSEPTTVTFFSWVGNQPTMKKFAADFHKQHPNITIKFENVNAENAGQVLSTRIAANNAPDVAFVNASDTADYASRGALVDLEPYIARSDVVDPDDYVDAFKTFVTYEDKMWGLPMG